MLWQRGSFHRQGSDPARHSSPRRTHNVCSGWGELEPRLLLSMGEGELLTTRLARAVEISLPHLPKSKELSHQGPPQVLRKYEDDDSSSLRTAIPIVPAVSYLVVPESTRSHSTIDTAQHLPDVPFFGVVGSLLPSDQVDLYQISVSPASSTLSIQVRLQHSSSDTGETIWLMDRTGRVLGFESVDPSKPVADVSMMVSLPAVTGVVYFGISHVAGDSASTAVSPVSYQVWFARGGRPGDWSESSGNATEPALVPTDPILSIIEGTHSETPTESTVTAPPLVPQDSTAGSHLVASGLLPTLSAAPSGGVLRVKGTPPRVDVNEVLPHVLGSEVSQAQAQAAQPAGRGASPEATQQAANGIAALTSTPQARRGPGGFPLIGTALLGDWPTQATAQDRLALEIAAEAIEPVPMNSQEITQDTDLLSSTSPPLGISLVGSLSLWVLFSKRDFVRHLADKLKRRGLTLEVKRSKPRRATSPMASR